MADAGDVVGESGPTVLIAMADDRAAGEMGTYLRRQGSEHVWPPVARRP
jgi:hypothetical protein